MKEIKKKFNYNWILYIFYFAFLIYQLIHSGFKYIFAILLIIVLAQVILKILIYILKQIYKSLVWFKSSKRNKLITLIKIYRYVSSHMTFITTFVIIMLIFVITFFTLKGYYVTEENIARMLSFSWIIFGITLTVFLFIYVYLFNYLANEKNNLVKFYKKNLISRKDLNALKNIYKSNLQDKTIIVYSLIVCSTLLVFVTTSTFVVYWVERINVLFFMVLFSFFICTNTFINLIINITKVDKYLSEKNNINISDNDFLLSDTEKELKYKDAIEQLYPLMVEKQLKENLKKEIEEYYQNSKITLDEQKKKDIIEELIENPKVKETIAKHKENLSSEDKKIMIKLIEIMLGYTDNN